MSEPEMVAAATGIEGPRSTSRLILHVINSLGLSGGAEQQLFSNIERFEDPSLRHHVAYLYSDDDPSWTSQLSVPVTALNGARSSVSLAVSAKRLWDLVRELKPALIHCSLVDASLISRVVGRLTGTPILESLVNISHEPIRTVDSSAVKEWKLAMHRTVDRITIGRNETFHALTEEVARSWSDTIGIERSRITIVPRGVSTQLIEDAQRDVDRPALRKELVGDHNLPLVLAVGREEPQKGHRYLIEAMGQVLRVRSDARLVMAGRSGTSTQAISDQISSLGLSDQILRLGVRDDVYRLMQAADLMVFPSIFEGLGVSLIEGMGSGLPVVVFDRAPMNQIIQHDRTGIVVGDRDVVALADAILRLIGEPAAARRMGSAAAAVVRTEYDLEQTSRRLEKLYLTILGPG
jgi:glycosyltransferase involved in cell wall biosynthesis